MNTWAAAALTLLALVAPACLWVVARGSTVHRLAGVSLLSTVTGAVFLVLPEVYDRSSYQDLALMLAVMAPTGTLVFTRFVGGQTRDAGAPRRSAD
ncbi:monovalent cation/H+ antiporter complex subunit F [Streptomyces sp. NPDC058964]|uniref:monovalent cation/H+ antiporter complex subunit F n=1 Tax=Streptomyces sp. NPDC058964 TaxID=3346681 RepID=UPI00369B22B0